MGGGEDVFFSSSVCLGILFYYFTFCRMDLTQNYTGRAQFMTAIGTRIRAKQCADKCKHIA